MTIFNSNLIRRRLIKNFLRNREPFKDEFVILFNRDQQKGRYSKAKKIKQRKNQD